MAVAPVCRVGDPLQITCTASAEFLEWSLTLTNEQGRDEEITTFSNSRDPSVQFTERTVNSTVFTFRRISAQGSSSPLISTLSIDSVSSGLNGVIVHCMDATNSMTSIPVSTTIHIIDTSA